MYLDPLQQDDTRTANHARSPPSPYSAPGMARLLSTGPTRTSAQRSREKCEILFGSRRLPVTLSIGLGKGGICRGAA